MKITNLLPEAGPYGSRNPDTMSASDYDRYQQDQMDQGKRDFKRNEHEAEWEREQEYTRQLQARDQGPWYLRIDGKILKSQGQPKVFDLKKGANNYALAIIKNKPELQGKIMLTKSSADQAPTEAASGGSSSSGNMASSSGRINPDTIVVQEHKKGVKAMKYTTKTRSPVAKAHQAIGSGSGEHKDKKKVATQVRGQKHKNKSTEVAESYSIRLERMTENARMLDEIMDPSGKWATAWRILGSRFAKAFPWLTVAGGVGGLAAFGVLAPMVAAAGGWATALTALTAGEAVSGLGMTALAAPTIMQQLKSFFSADEESISAAIKKWVASKVGDEADVKEFVILHAKSVLEGKPSFRWRAQEWKTYLSAKAAEAYLEKNDKYWLDTFNQQKAEKEKPEQEKPEQGMTERGEPRTPPGHFDSMMPQQLSTPTRGVDKKGRTQAQWLQLVKQKFPNAKVMVAKMQDGPCIATLADGRKLYWSKVEQAAAEGYNPNSVSAQHRREIQSNHEANIRKKAETGDPDAKKRLELMLKHKERRANDYAARMEREGVAEGFNGEYDDEAGMAQSNLRTMARAVDGLLKTIKKNDNLPEWGQEKIAKAEMMLVSVWDYLLSQKEMGMDPKQGVAESNWYELRLSQLLESDLKK